MPKASWEMTPDGRSAPVVTPEQAEIARLRAEAARLKMERDIAKSRGVLCAGRAARYAWIVSMKGAGPSRCAKLLEVSRKRVFQLGAAKGAYQQPHSKAQHSDDGTAWRTSEPSTSSFAASTAGRACIKEPARAGSLRVSRRRCAS